jgi:hypothetical protein
VATSNILNIRIFLNEPRLVNGDEVMYLVVIEIPHNGLIEKDLCFVSVNETINSIVTQGRVVIVIIW